MSNYVASFLFGLSYTGPDSEPASRPTETVDAPYQPLNEGIIDVPAATAAATTFSAPFGTIGVDATGGIIKNRTGQNLNMKINGAAAASNSIAPGGVFCWANPVTASTPILSIDLITTAIQSGNGQIEYRFFGDPI